MKALRFKKAHEIARATKTAAGSYRIAFACALRDIYAEEKAAKVETTLLGLGFDVWEKYDYRRIYINERDLGKVFDVEIERYNSGNLFSVWIGGEKISNSKGYGILGEKVFYDCKKQAWSGNERILNAIRI